MNAGLNVDFMKRWVAALRSGNYTQTRGALHRTDGSYCANGVALELTAAIRWVMVGTPFDFKIPMLKDSPDGAPYTGEADNVLPKHVLSKTAGVPSEFFSHVEFWNDGYSYTFDEIADRIEMIFPALRRDDFDAWLARLESTLLLSAPVSEPSNAEPSNAETDTAPV